MTTKAIDVNNKKNMTNYSFLLLALLSALLLQATAAGAEKIRIIMDTDALAEVDDQHAMAYMLFSGDHFEVEGITVNRGSDRPHRTDRDQDINDHFREAVNVVKMCHADVPVLKGPTGNYRQLKGDIEKSAFDGSDAVHFIIERAHAPSDRPLILFACGNLTNVALALLRDPTIAPKIEIWWVGTEWPQDYACNNHAGDLDAVDAILANPQNVAFNIIPWPNGIWTNHAEIYQKMPGKGPEVSPGVPGRWGGSFTCFGDYSVELFRRGVWSGQKRRSLLDAFGFAVLKNKSWFTPTTMGAPSFKRTDPSAEEKHKYPGEWVANESNPRRVTIWRDGQMTPVIADFWDTFNNPVLPRQQPDDSDGGQEPMKIILDTDIDGDIDDVGAMAMLHAMADNGEIEILAVMVSSKHEWSAPAVDVINTYYNRPNIPIGVPKGEGRDANSRYARQLAEAFPHTLRSNSDAPDAVTLYREILSRQPDTSVVIATIGYLTNLHELLNSKADQYSSLNGKDLVKRKVKRYVCMASGVGNFRPHAEAAVNVVNNWPTLTVHTKGQDFAWSMMTGSVLQQTPSNSPVRRAYEHYFGGTVKNRHSADQLSLLVAVRGVDPHFRLTTQGYMDVGNGTRSDWNASPDNPLHHWVDWYRDGVDPAVVKNAIEKLMTQLPADSTPRRVPFVDGRVAGSAAGLGAGKAPLKLLFDTDIGADIDDEMTLIYLLNSPEIDLRGVTTVYGDPFSRAEFARGLIAAMGRGGKIPVHAGARVPMDEAPDERTDAVKFIVRSILQADGPRHLLLTGGHTNIGMALRENPALTERLVGIALMGFDFKSFRGAFNLDSDIDAAEAVLTSGIPLRVIPREIGVACQLQQKEYNRLLASECPQMIFIRERMQRWVRHVRQRPRVPIPDYLPRPYDPLTAMTLTHPELFQWKRGTIELIDLTPVAGRRRVNTRFRESADGLHEIVVGVEREKAMLLLLERLLIRHLSSRPPSDPEPSAGREQKG